MANISLILPTYNRYDMLRVTMPHYLALCGIKEILIIDDGLDGTQSYVSKISQKYHKVRYLHRDARGGLPAARNAGLDHVASDTDYVLFGEDDVLMPQDYATTLLARMRSHRSDIAGGRRLMVKSGESLEECVRRYQRYLEIYMRHRKPIPLVNPKLMLANFFIDRTQPALFLSACSLFKREVFKDIRFEEKYRYNYFREETDLHLQAKMHGFRAIYVGDCTSFALPRTTGGCHEYGLAVPHKLASLLALVNFQGETYCTLNNGYFLDKFYDYLRNVCHYTHPKGYYKLVFALHLLKLRLRLPFEFIARITLGADVADYLSVAQ